MARVDRNRFRKIYGAKRTKPVYEEVGEATIIRMGSLETIEVLFNNQNSVLVQCSILYQNPVVIITPTHNVNTYVSGVYQSGNVTAIRVNTSAPITGTVFIAVGEATEEL